MGVLERIIVHYFIKGTIIPPILLARLMVNQSSEAGQWTDPTELRLLETIIVYVEQHIFTLNNTIIKFDIILNRRTKRNVSGYRTPPLTTILGKSHFSPKCVSWTNHV